MPPFFVPIAAFILWAFALLSFFPVLKLDLGLSSQFLAPQFLGSLLILFLAWALSGPVTAAVLSLLSSILVVYLCLGAKEPAYFLQVILYGASFVFTVFYLYKIQKIGHVKNVAIEKLSEDVVLTQGQIQKKVVLEKSLEKKLERFSQLHRLAEELKGVRKLDEIAWKIVSQIKTLIPHAETCSLYLLSTEHQNLSLIACASLEKPREEKEGTIFDWWVMKRSQGLLVSDTHNDFRFPSDAPKNAIDYRSICASPLLSERKVLGLVRVSCREPGAFSNDDLRLLDIYAGLGAVLLNNILLYDRMQELAIRDSLTGLYINRYFSERLTAEVQRSHFNKSVFSLLMIDIDFFKRFNDDYGHAAGDVILRHISQRIQTNIESVDLAARYGGEEFAVLLPGKTKAQAMKIAEKIRSNIEKSRFALRRLEGKVTVSIGVAAFPAQGRTREEMVWSADKNLYTAKNKGRNRVCGSS